MITEEELYKEIRRVVPLNKHFKYLPNHMREDVVMTVFEKSVKKLRDGSISGDWKDIKNYVFIIGLNTTSKELNNLNRKNDIFNSNYTDDVINEIENGSQSASLPNYDIEDDIILNDYVKLFIDSITDDTTKEIFRLRMEGYLFKEIAEKVNLNLKTTQNKYFHKLETFRKHNGIIKGENKIIQVKRNKKEKPKERMVINTETGIIYNSIGEAAKAEGLNYSTLYHYIIGGRTNKTNLIEYTK